MGAKNITPVTPPSTAYTKPRVDFVKSDFDALIWQKGYNIIHEMALPCPCKSRNSGHQSNCRNCGSTGWLFVNAKNTRMVLIAMNIDTKYKEWSEENRGTVSISARAEDECSFMDRITVLDGNAIFGQVLFLKTYNSDYYWNTIYDIKEILFIALFSNTDEKLNILTYGKDFTINGNNILFLPTSNFYSLIDPSKDEQDISITVRYKHSPQFHILDIPRETMQTIQFKGAHGNEEPVDLPIHCIARRSHFVLDAENNANTRLFRNDHNFQFEDLNPSLDKC